MAEEAVCSQHIVLVTVTRNKGRTVLLQSTVFPDGLVAQRGGSKAALKSCQG